MDEAKVISNVKFSIFRLAYYISKQCLESKWILLSTVFLIWIYTSSFLQKFPH